MACNAGGCTCGELIPQTARILPFARLAEHVPLTYNEQSVRPRLRCDASSDKAVNLQ